LVLNASQEAFLAGIEASASALKSVGRTVNAATGWEADASTGAPASVSITAEEEQGPVQPGGPLTTITEGSESQWSSPSRSANDLSAMDPDTFDPNIPAPSHALKGQAAGSGSSNNSLGGAGSGRSGRKPSLSGKAGKSEFSQKFLQTLKQGSDKSATASYTTVAAVDEELSEDAMLEVEGADDVEEMM
jgi:hypothetical protein